MRHTNQTFTSDTPTRETSEELSDQGLKAEARQRAKQQPLFKRIVSTLRGEQKPFQEMIINAESFERRVVQLSDGILDKFEVERVDEQRMVGSIFKGEIQNLDLGLKAAFVDIGQSKNAFLHYWDITPAAVAPFEYDLSKAPLSRDKISAREIEKRYPAGTEIVVQVTKSQIGSKGPRTSTQLVLPGRFLVLRPYSDQSGISGKVEDRKERQRLKQILNELAIPEGMGVILRTAGIGKKAQLFIRDLELLLDKWEEIHQEIQQLKAPALVYQEPNLIERTIRDFLIDDIDRILIDNKDGYEFMFKAIARIAPRSKNKITHFKETIPIFERFNIERQIERTYHRRVPLPSGGQIVIQETEALVAIDVNTGSHKIETKSREDYILRCNIEAAQEAARQIRLRNIGGLIIIDFIDMRSRKERKVVYDVMCDAMTEDKAKNNILSISPLGILQMTRQRQRESFASRLYRACPSCQGSGMVKTVRTVGLDVQRRLAHGIRRLRMEENRSDLQLSVHLHPTVLEQLQGEDAALLDQLEQYYAVGLSFIPEPSYPVEIFHIFDPETNRELL